LLQFDRIIIASEAHNDDKQKEHLMNSTEIIIKDLSKNYGKVQALNNVSLHIEEGMFGLLGRNGAGKTTLMKILSTILNKTAGDVSICGMDIKRAKEIRGIVGYLPQEFSFYPNMGVYEALDYLGLLSGMSSDERRNRIAQMLKMVNLTDARKVKVKALSGGMKRRLGIAQALLHDPKILIVDEPTAGLDPEERVRFRNLLTETAEDRIVILSTHIVEDIEKTCDRLAVLDAGEILFNGSLTEFTSPGEPLEDAYMRRIGGRS
jgi:ABC-2 type transport system ATP-binding protein